MHRFSCDTRSLRAFRVALGALLLVDLLIRAGDLVAHYTDAGILPRDILAAGGNWRWDASLHSLSGGWILPAALFFVAAVAAVALLVGYRTRAAAFVSWVLLYSLHNRNTPVCSGADLMLQVLLFWSMFLPFDTRRKGRVVSAGTIALTAQVVMIYVFTALLKTGVEWGAEGSAMAYALRLDHLVRPFGRSLLGLPDGLLVAGTHAVWWLELLGPFLLFVPRLRGLAVVAFMLFHLGTALTMHLGLFPFVGMAAWLPFVPSSFWKREPVRAWLVREPLGFRACVLALAGYTLVWNVAGLENATSRLGPAAQVGAALGLDQSWAMFAPRPQPRDGWLVVEGELADGRTVDLLAFLRTGEARPAAGAAKPDHVAALYGDVFWNKYFYHLAQDRNPVYLDRFAGYLREQWNGASPLRDVRITYMLELTTRHGEEEPEPIVLWPVPASPTEEETSS